jgi:hypothetical protein
MSQAVKDFIEHLSEKPWSDYTKADYSIEQWHAACLIHLHQGAPTSKNQCKLPVKTPNGAVNRNGVHAALAALHGARTPLNAPSDQKAKAERQLRSLYSQLDEKFPSTVAASMDKIRSFIEHHGIKGMRWGVRRSQAQLSRATGRTAYGKSPSRLTTAELDRRIKRMEAEKRYNELNKRDVSAGEKMAKEILTNVGKNVVTNIATTALTGLGAYALKKQLGKSAQLPEEVVNRMTGFGKKRK